MPPPNPILDALNSSNAQQSQQSQKLVSESALDHVLLCLWRQHLLRPATRPSSDGDQSALNSDPSSKNKKSKNQHASFDAQNASQMDLAFTGDRDWAMARLERVGARLGYVQMER